MSVEVESSSDRQVVTVTWDKSLVNGEVVKLYCVNPANGDVSVSGLSANDGEGYVSYPAGYTGTSEITVYDNDGNADYGVVTVDEDGATTDPDAHPEHPIVLPPDTDLEPSHPIALPDPHPEHPIVLPPLGIWGDVEAPEHPIVLPPDGPPVYPSHPIVEPPDMGFNPPDSEFPEHPEPNK